MPKKKTNIDEITCCSECDSTNITQDYDRGELVCNDCGLVLDDAYIDPGPEYRIFDEEGRSRQRTGPPSMVTLHDKGLPTDISPRDKDSYGRDIPARNRAQMYRLRKWQRRVRVSSALERNLAFAMGELDRMSSRMGLPRHIREEAASIYRKAVNLGLIRGRSIEGVAAAVLYAACRRCGVPRTLDEIADAAKVGRKEIGRTYRFVSRELGLHLLPTSPNDYVRRFCSVLHMSSDAQKKAFEIIKLAEESDLVSGRGPTGVAAAAVYIAAMLCSENRTQREVADVSGVTEVTIRNRYKEMVEVLGIRIPP